ncbi:dihydrouridine synthase protein [Cystoisospora suis]|uniref:Dihydrouridine synthase protein n=1 Tax=Cystoisospora suis TaxID=483139 RepID=A0A2C6L4B4_9APIC|nr:dihydrouridine synthase protein [Cystoisospora suis]
MGAPLYAHPGKHRRTSLLLSHLSPDSSENSQPSDSSWTARESSPASFTVQWRRKDRRGFLSNLACTKSIHQRSPFPFLVYRGGCIPPRRPHHKNHDTRTGRSNSPPPHTKFLPASQACSCHSFSSFPAFLSQRITAYPWKSVFFKTSPLSFFRSLLGEDSTDSFSITPRVQYPPTTKAFTALRPTRQLLPCPRISPLLSGERQRGTDEFRSEGARSLSLSLRNKSESASFLIVLPSTDDNRSKKKILSSSPVWGKKEALVSSYQERLPFQRPRFHMTAVSMTVGRGERESYPGKPAHSLVDFSKGTLMFPDRSPVGLLSTAPMMDYTDSHWRMLMSFISRHLTLYTEMVSIPPSFSSLPPSVEPKVDPHYRIFQRLVGEVSSCRDLSNPCILQLGLSCLQAAYNTGRLIASEALFQANEERKEKREESTVFRVNLNCGCPSPRVAKSGTFGLSLMKDAKRVGDLCRRLYEGFSDLEMPQGRYTIEDMDAVERNKSCPYRFSSPSHSGFVISVKCRVGIVMADEGEEEIHGENEPKSFTEMDIKSRDRSIGGTRKSTPYTSSTSSCTYESLASFIDIVSSSSPVKHFEVHARPGILGGLTPKQNRCIPELKPAWVYQLCKDFPHLSFTLNGGITSFHEAEAHLIRSEDLLAGVMIGRGLLERPWYWASGADAFVERQLRRRDERDRRIERKDKEEELTRQGWSTPLVDEGNESSQEDSIIRRTERQENERRQESECTAQLSDGSTLRGIESRTSVLRIYAPPCTVTGAPKEARGSSSTCTRNCYRCMDTSFDDHVRTQEKEKSAGRLVTRREVLEAYAKYADYIERKLLLREAGKMNLEGGQMETKREKKGQEVRIKGQLQAVLKPLWNLFVGERGSRAFKQALQNAGEWGGAFPENRDLRRAVGSSRDTEDNGAGDGQSRDGCYDDYITQKEKQVYVHPGTTRRGMTQSRSSLGDIIRRATEKVPDEVLDRKNEET